MKKVYIALIVILCLSVSSITAYAQNSNHNDNIIDGVMTINDDLGAYKDDIFEDYCRLISEQTENYIPKEEDIQYDKALKTYWGMPLLEENELTRDVFNEFISLSGYMYDVPVYCENNFTALMLVRADDVVSENRYSFDFSQQNSKIYANADAQWSAQSINPYPVKDFLKPVYDLLDTYEITDSEVFCVNNIGCCPTNVFVIFKENSSSAEFIVVKEIKEDGTIVPNTEFGERLYTYNDLKELDAIYSVSDESGFIGGESAFFENHNNVQYAMTACGAVLAVSALALVIKLALKKKKCEVK